MSVVKEVAIFAQQIHYEASVRAGALKGPSRGPHANEELRFRVLSTRLGTLIASAAIVDVREKGAVSF